VKLGDEDQDIVAVSVHSLVAADWANQTDSLGAPCSRTQLEGTVQRIAGIPIVKSDRTAAQRFHDGHHGGPVTTLTGVVAATGSATFAIAVTDVTQMGPWQLAIEVLSTGECGAATIRFLDRRGKHLERRHHDLGDGRGDIARRHRGRQPGGKQRKHGRLGDVHLWALATIWWTASSSEHRHSVVRVADLASRARARIGTRGRPGLETDRDILEDTTIGACTCTVHPRVRRRVAGTRPGVLRSHQQRARIIGGDMGRCSPETTENELAR